MVWYSRCHDEQYDRGGTGLLLGEEPRLLRLRESRRPQYRPLPTGNRFQVCRYPELRPETRSMKSLSGPSIQSIRLLLRMAGLAAALLVASDAAAQPTDEPQPFCRRGGPSPDCGAFLVAHLNYCPEWNAAARDPSEPWRLAEWEVGAMVNHRPMQAVGGAVAVGTSRTGFHLALKARYRRWLHTGSAVEAGAGLIMSQHPPETYPHQTIGGLTVDATIGLTDWVSVSARGYVFPDGAGDGGSLSAVELGARVGTVPGVIVTVLGLTSLLGDALRAP